MKQIKTLLAISFSLLVLASSLNAYEIVIDKTGESDNINDKIIKQYVDKTYHKK